MNKEAYKGKADEFVKDGEKYFYLYIPGLKLKHSVNYCKQNEIIVTEKRHIDKERGLVEFNIQFHKVDSLKYKVKIYNERVRGNYAFLEGNYETAIVKYDKANVKKAVMNMAQIKLNGTLSPKKKEAILHNTKYILKEISKIKI